MRLLAAAGFALLTLAPRAQAQAAAGKGTATSITLTLDDAGNLAAQACQPATRGDALGADDELMIKVADAAHAETALPEALTVEGGDGAKAIAVGAGPYRVTGDFAGKELTVKTAGAELCRFNFAGKQASPPPEGPGLAALDEGARQELSRNHVTDHGLDGGALGRRYTLYHLPSGNPAFAIPAHMDERDQVTIAMVVPEGSAPSLEVLSCEKPPAFRVQGSISDLTKAIGAFQSREGQKPARRYLVHRFAARFQCSGELSYRLTLVPGAGQQAISATTSIAIDPVHRLELGLAAIFDFGRPTSLGLGDRALAGGGTEKFVSSTRDYTGFKALVTLALHPCGANPADWKPCDWVAPLIGVDPSRVSKGFAAGLMVSPIPELGIVGGVTVFESDALLPGSGLAPGDKFTASGDLPKRSTFSSDGVGFFLGVNLTSEVISRLTPK